MLFRSREGDGMSFGLVRRASRDRMSSRSRLVGLRWRWRSWDLRPRLSHVVAFATDSMVGSEKFSPLPCSNFWGLWEISPSSPVCRFGHASRSRSLVTVAKATVFDSLGRKSQVR